MVFTLDDLRPTEEIPSTRRRKGHLHKAEMLVGKREQNWNFRRPDNPTTSSPESYIRLFYFVNGTLRDGTAVASRLHLTEVSFDARHTSQDEWSELARTITAPIFEAYSDKFPDVGDILAVNWTSYSPLPNRFKGERLVYQIDGEFLKPLNTSIPLFRSLIDGRGVAKAQYDLLFAKYLPTA